MLQTGLLDGTALTNLHNSSAQPIDLLTSALDISVPLHSHVAHKRLGSAYVPESSAAAGDANAQLREENERLKQQLAEAEEATSQWQQLHSELHAFCVDKVLKTAQT